MPLPRDPATRLAHLEEILAQTTSGTTPVTGGANAVDVHLNSVPVERIRRLTLELRHESGDPDPVDGIAMRLLINEYVTAVAHLRAVAQMAATRIDHAAAPVREAKRAVYRFDKTVETAPWLKQRAEAAAQPSKQKTVNAPE